MTREARGRAVRPAVAVAVLLAGCLAPAPIPTDDTLDAEPLAISYAHTCPQGAEAWRLGEVCGGTLRTTDEARAEAVAAVGPDGEFAIAWISQPAVARVVPTTTGVEYEILGLSVAFSEDGGTSWRHTTVPRPSSLGGGLVRYARGGDPSIAFDAGGTLHVVGISATTDRATDRSCSEFFHVATPDQGRGWTTPVSLTGCEAGDDRPWVSAGDRGEAIVTWDRWGNADYEREVVLTRTADGGTTWRAPVRHGGCGQASPAIVAPGGVLVACAVIRDPGPDGTAVEAHVGVGVLRLSNDGATFAVLSDVPGTEGAVWPQLALAPDGTLVVQADDVRVNPEPLRLARSMDGGATWSDVVDLRDFVRVDDGATEGGTYLGAFAADAWGGAHVLVAYCTRGGSEVFVAEACAPRTAHVAVDVSDLAVLAEARLRPDLPRARPPAVGAPPDHTAGVAFGAQVGLLAWSAERGIDFTVVRRE